MAEVATHAIILWDGKSPGTAGMMELLVRKGTPHVVVVRDPTKISPRYGEERKEE